MYVGSCTHRLATTGYSTFFKSKMVKPVLSPSVAIALFVVIAIALAAFVVAFLVVCHTCCCCSCISVASALFVTLHPIIF
jgi:hypothetical protein